MFLNAHASEPRFEEDVSVRLRFSRRLDRRSEIPKVTIVPAVEGVKSFRNGSELVLTGQFEAGGNYRITVPGILLSDDNKTLGEDHVASVDIPQRSASLSLEHGSGILSPLGGLALEMKSVNVPEVRLTAWRVHENNLIPYLHRNGLSRTGRSV